MLKYLHRNDILMGLRTVLPLFIALVALAVHFGIEVQRSNVAALGVSYDENVQPAARSFLAALVDETTARFSTTTSVSGLTTLANVDNLVAADPTKTSVTDSRLAALSSAISSLRSDSRSLADTTANLDSCSSPTCGTSAIASQLTTLRSGSSSVAAVLSSFNAIARILSRTTFGVFVDTVSPQQSGRFLDHVAAPYIELLTSSYLEVSSLRALLMRSGSLNAATSTDASNYASIGAFVAARAQLRYYLSFHDLPFGLVDQTTYNTIIGITTTELSASEALLSTDSSVLQTTTLSLTLAQVNNIAAAVNAVLAVLNTAPTSFNKTEVRGVWVALGVLVGTILCFFAALVVSLRHYRVSVKSTHLLAEFSRADEIKSVAKAYQPVIAYLRTDLLPAEKPSNEVGRVYDDIARLVLEIRPFLPQTLFGMFVDEQRDSASLRKLAAAAAIANNSGNGSSQPADALAMSELDDNDLKLTFMKAIAPPRTAKEIRAWHPHQYPIRLDSAVSQATCTFLTVVPLRDTSHARRQAADGTLLSWYNGVLATVVTLVNASGGAIHAVECSGVIVCVWNLMSACSAPASIALQVARALLRSFDKLDMNIVTGACMAANAKTGRRRNVVIVGSALEFAERVLLLNRLHCVSITIDFDSYRDLSLEEQSLCRPIALLHSSPSNRVVLYSADWSATQPPHPKQRKDYNAAFALYQNGMFEESINAFGSYLQAYDRDGPAEWIISYLLSHKLRPVESIAKSTEVHYADHGGVALTLEDLAVWGG